MKRKPNILWIVSDQHIRPHRPDAIVFPLQSLLGEKGISFTRSYSVLPICSPARASMLTGLYPHAHGLTENDGRFGGRPGLNPGDWILQHALSDAGYRCGWFGKWHVDNTRSATDYGFEGFSLPGYGYPYASEVYQQYIKRRGLPKPIAEIELNGESGLAVGTRVDLADARDWFDFESGCAILRGPKETHEAFFLVDQALHWLAGDFDQPFFLRVDTWGPHPPYLVAESLAGYLDQASIGLPTNFSDPLQHRPDHHRAYRDYWRSVLQLDDADWRLMYQRAIEHAIQVELALAGLLDRIDLNSTLVIFTSDHGDAVGTNGGVANKGGLMVEATLQIPMLLAGIGIDAGQARRQLVSHLDLVPTLMEICGLEAGREMHGESLVPLFTSDGIPWRDGLMAQHYGLHEPIAQRAWYSENFKLVVQPDGFCELYDLENDPQELHNLAMSGDCDRVLVTLREQLAEAMQAVGDCEPGIGEFLSELQ